MSVVGCGVPGVCEHGDCSAPPSDAGFPALSRPRLLASGVGPAEGVSTPSWPSWASACGSPAGPGWGAPVSDVGSPRGGRPPPRCTLLPVLPVPEAALSGPGNAKGLRLRRKSGRRGRRHAVPRGRTPYLQSRRSACRIRVWVLERAAQRTPGRCPGRRDGGVSAQRACAWPFQALEKIQEDNRLELQKVGLRPRPARARGWPTLA